MFFSAIESPLLIAGFFIQLTVKQLRAILDKDWFNKYFLNQYFFKPKYTRKTTLV